MLSHEMKVLGDHLEQVSDGVGQLGMGGGEVGSGSGLASPGLSHCLAEEFMVDLPQELFELTELAAVVAESSGQGEDACTFPEAAPLGEVLVIAGIGASGQWPSFSMSRLSLRPFRRAGPSEIIAHGMP